MQHRHILLASMLQNLLVILTVELTFYTSLEEKIEVGKKSCISPSYLLDNVVVGTITFPPVPQITLQIHRTAACSHSAKISAQDF